MKKKLLVVLGFAAVMLASCGEHDLEMYRMVNMAGPTVYGYDTLTGLCFVQFYKVHTNGEPTGMTNVPCTPKVLDAIKYKKKGQIFTKQYVDEN